MVYTRWGRTTCSNTTGTQLLYAGKAAGSHYWNERGGGANYLCLPEQPQYTTYTAGVQSRRAYLYGAEYETGLTNPGEIGPLSAVNDHNVPCAVCYTSTRQTDDSCTTYLSIILDQGVLWISHGTGFFSASYNV